MSKSTQTVKPSHDGLSNTDHQRTYRADEIGHRSLIDAAGSAVSLAGGGSYSLKRQVGPVTLDRTLVTWYFDTEERHLHASGSMLRWRGKQGANGELPSKGLLEARVLENGQMRRTSGSEYGSALRLESLDDPAINAVQHLTNGQPLSAVATQSKHRRFLFAGAGPLGAWRPDFVIALDDVNLTSHSDPQRQANRLETEIQIFTKLPWLRTVDASRVTRFEAFVEAMVSAYSLERAAESSYQAVPKDLLT